MNEQELLKKKKEIENSKEKLQQLKGKQQILLEQLKSNWNCDSIEDARKLVKSMEKQLKKLNDIIEEKKDKLVKEYFTDGK